MASIGNAIYAKLTGDSAVAAITTTVIPNYAPKSSTYPQVVYEVKSTEYDATYTGNSGLVKCELVLRCLVNSRQGYDACNTLGNAVAASLDQATGTFGGVAVQRFFLNDDAEDQFEDQDSDEIVYYVRELNFEVWFNA